MKGKVYTADVFHQHIDLTLGAGLTDQRKIAGGADTYYGQNKAKSRDRLIGRLTLIVAIVFSVLVVAMYIVIARLGTSFVA